MHVCFVLKTCVPLRLYEVGPKILKFIPKSHSTKNRFATHQKVKKNPWLIPHFPLSTKQFSLTDLALTNNPCSHFLRFFCRLSIYLSSFSSPFNFQDFECNVNRIRSVIPDWNNIKDFPLLLPHLENYLFSPNFSPTIRTLKNTTPNLVYACPTRFVSFQQPDIKSDNVHVCFVVTNNNNNNNNNNQLYFSRVALESIKYW